MLTTAFPRGSLFGLVQPQGGGEQVVQTHTRVIERFPQSRATQTVSSWALGCSVPEYLIVDRFESLCPVNDQSAIIHRALIEYILELFVCAEHAAEILEELFLVRLVRFSKHKYIVHGGQVIWGEFQRIGGGDHQRRLGVLPALEEELEERVEMPFELSGQVTGEMVQDQARAAVEVASILPVEVNQLFLTVDELL